MFYKIGKKTTKVSEDKFREYISKENLIGKYIHSGLIYFVDDEGTIKAKLDNMEEA